MSFFANDELEKYAAQSVVKELGAVTALKRDVPGAPSGTRDYDVVFADGHEEPLEVTSNLDTQVMNALRRSDGGILQLQADVKRLWMVVCSPTWIDEKGHEQPFDSRRIAEILTPLIEQLEEERAESFEPWRLAWPMVHGDPGHHRQVGRELHNLGVAAGDSFAPTHPDRPGIFIHLSGGGAWGPETITSALEERAALDDNVAKLEARREAVRRHLFVVLSSRGASDMAGWALQDFLDGRWVWDKEPPLPKLPEAITTIWAANRTGGIYSTPPEGWRRFAGAARP